MIAKSLSLISSGRWMGLPSAVYRAIFSSSFLMGIRSVMCPWPLPAVEWRSARDVVAEEPGLFGPGVGDQGLLRGQFELEVIVQECPQLVLDLLGFIPRSSEAEQEIVGIPDVPQPAIVRIELVARRPMVPHPLGTGLGGPPMTLVLPP